MYVCMYQSTNIMKNSSKKKTNIMKKSIKHVYMMLHEQYVTYTDEKNVTNYKTH